MLPVPCRCLQSEYYKNAMKPTGNEQKKTTGGPRLPKMPPLQDFQFFNVGLLHIAQWRHGRSARLACSHMSYGLRCWPRAHDTTIRAAVWVTRRRAS